MRVLLADDQRDVRSALKLLLEHEPGVRVIGEAVEADELLARMDSLKPDLVMLDWELPGQRYGDLLAALRLSSPGVAIVALSGWPEARQAALAAGADGFVSKGDPPELLLATLRAIGAGR